jgi:putative glycosyltransferase
VYAEFSDDMSMKLSIVTALYYSAPYIDKFYQRISTCARRITDEYEIIFVNDGSPDNVVEKAIRLFEQDPKVKVIDLSRNFGHHKALMTGLSYATGEYIFVIDVDLEEEPEWLQRFWDELHNVPDTDMVFGVQESRKGDWFRRWSGDLFFDLFNFFSDITLTKNLVMARLMTRKYVENLLKHTEREVVFSGICGLTGFRQKALFVKKHHKGSTTYSIKKRIDMAINMLASFSSKPLLYIFYLGMAMTLFSLLFSLYIIVRRILFGMLAGWASIVASIWLVGGMIIFSIGIVGIYLSKVFIEVKHRPYTIVKKFYAR